jgi:magnesium-protoporphyrin O-methyltransferase
VSVKIEHWEQPPSLGAVASHLPGSRIQVGYSVYLHNPMTITTEDPKNSPDRPQDSSTGAATATSPDATSGDGQAATTASTASDNKTDDKTIVRDYFNSTGFDRWRRIYGDGEVNSVQLDIRQGHQKTVDTLLGWLKADDNLSGLTVCDAGCGVGTLSIPLAEAGAKVFASDISQKMVEEAQERAKALFGHNDNPTFGVQDLETLSGSYHTVICLDVLIHYPTEQAAAMIKHLSSLAQSRLILSFAPKTPCLVLLKKIGELFPGPSKTTRAYQHRKIDIIKILEGEGWKIERKTMTSTRFYFSQMLEAVKP